MTTVKHFYIGYVLGVIITLLWLFGLAVFGSTHPLELVLLVGSGWPFSIIGIIIGSRQSRLRMRTLWACAIAIGFLATLLAILVFAGRRPFSVLQCVALFGFVLFQMAWGAFMRILADRFPAFQFRAGVATAVCTLAIFSVLVGVRIALGFYN